MVRWTENWWPQVVLFKMKSSNIFKSCDHYKWAWVISFRILNSWPFNTISTREPGTSGTTVQNYAISLPELQQFHGVRRFELERSCCFSALLLDEERGRLFVGAKNFLLSLSLDNIAKQEHKVGPSWWKQETPAACWIHNSNLIHEINVFSKASASESSQASLNKETTSLK